MTGPEHYAEAERLIAPDGPALELELIVADVAVAQVHATLALAAATALRGSNAENTLSQWLKVAAVRSQGVKMTGAERREYGMEG